MLNNEGVHLVDTLICFLILRAEQKGNLAKLSLSFGHLQNIHTLPHYINYSNPNAL